MQFVIAACADQAELLLESLNGRPYRSCDLLSGGDPDYAKEKYIKLLASGDKTAIMQLPIPLSSVEKALEKSIWKDGTTVFGPVVCSLIPIIKNFVHIFSYSF
jgi:hypothetical protein